uniref:Reverse transcriptase domain-containing protein n=1 Tax=Fagus sylvatica TaxID=28930 RepID=A0A2N9HN71_FAGSY
MEEITGRWQDLSLTEKEGSLIVLTPEEADDGSMLAAWFLTPRMINMESVLRALKPLWRPGTGFKARDMDWMTLSPFSKACFDFMSFWVQIHDLPVKMMKPAACARIGSTLGTLEHVEDVGEGHSKGSFMRVRVAIDIRQPLCRGRKVGLGGKGECWVSFRYERLTNFCYWCGRITHGEKDCEIWLRSRGSLSSDQQPYGAWMKGESERMGRHPSRLADKLGDRSGGVQGGMSRRSPANCEEMQQTPPNGKFPNPRVSGNHIPRNQEKDMMEQSKESNLGTQRNACMENRKKGSEEVILENGQEGPNTVTPTVKEVLNGMVDKDPSLFVPKFKKKTPNSTWKRSVGQPKDSLHDVPIFTIAGSKRGNEDIMVEAGEWMKGGKRVCNEAVQGLGNPKAVRALHNMVKMKGPKVLFLLETKLNTVRMEGVRVKLGFENVFSVPSLGRSGGLALLWQNEAEIVIQNFSQHHIDAHVESQQVKCWRLTGFYGRPEHHRRKESWALLKHLSTMDSAPWLCLGDFNELLALHEKRGGNARSLRQILEFQDAVNACNLVDLGYRGASYTWNNNRDDVANVQGRLDRALATSTWLDWFPQYSVTHCPGSVSDHLAVVVLTKTQQGVQRQKKWLKRFEEKWATHPACEEVIRSSWNQQVDVGSPMFQLCQKISRCRKALVDWSRTVFGDLEPHRMRLICFYIRMNSIGGKDHAKFGDIAVQYFKEIFSSSAGVEVEDTVRVIDRVVTTDMNCQLLSPFTAMEIQQAAFQMHPSKSPGPDGRQITDNVAVAFELMHALRSRRKGKVSQMAIKLDMSKAYDRVEWTFLERVMQRMGFESRWIHLMMVCVRTTSYSVLLNGEPTGYIKPSRGIRQGDPLSPYLFLFCAEGLTALLRQAGREKRINGVSICRGGPKISHLLFADDSLLFCDASIAECSRLLEVLTTYEKASGQIVNRDKTALFFSKNTPDHMRDSIQELWGVRGVANFERYLGLPAMVGKSKQQTFMGLKEVLARRLQGWKERSLSKAGRAILIKTIAQAIPTYTMTCFKLPKVWCDSVNSLVSKYWWGQTKEENKIHWLSWGQLCSHKNEGGMGFRDLHCFNLALLAKQGWRMLTNQQSLFARVFQSKYFPGGSFFRAKLGSNPSFIWRSILAARDLLLKGIRWSLGNGKEVNIWKDDWGVSDLHKRPHAREVQWVAELIDPNRGAWDVSVLQEVFDPGTALRIQQMPLSNPTGNDSFTWKANTTGVFSVKSAYQLAYSTRSTGVEGSSSNMLQYRKFWKGLWKIKVPTKIKIHLWRACMNAIPTGLALHRRRVISDPLCPICCGGVETPTHALWTCPYAGSVWALAPGRLSKMPVMDTDFFLLSSKILNTMSSEVVEMWAAIGWAIWYARNKFVHEKFLPTPQATIDMAIRLLNDFKRVTAG